mmetsp:Transcript_8584/g.17412  ORF Transcript_8584/g.17412 Transcript_8584/m.17412 type:complete len:230 (-) Transcript_8584:1684-2373(-)
MFKFRFPEFIGGQYFLSKLSCSKGRQASTMSSTLGLTTPKNSTIPLMSLSSSSSLTSISLTYPPSLSTLPPSPSKLSPWLSTSFLMLPSSVSKYLMVSSNCCCSFFSLSSLSSSLCCKLSMIFLLSLSPSLSLTTSFFTPATLSSISRTAPSILPWASKSDLMSLLLLFATSPAIFSSPSIRSDFLMRALTFLLTTGIMLSILLSFAVISASNLSALCPIASSEFLSVC